MSISKFYLSNLNKEVKVAAANARELALMRDGCLFASGIDFYRDILFSAITELVTVCFS